MGHLKIYCANCTGKWEVYKRDMKSDTERVCPYCGKEIRQTIWEKVVIPGFERMEQVDNALAVEYLDRKSTFFGVSYSTDSVWLSKARR